MSGNERSTVELLNAQDVGRTVARIAHQIIEKTTLDDSDGPQVILPVSYTHLTLPTKA